MNRTSYPVVALILVILALVGVGAKVAEEFLPPEPENDLARDAGGFLRQASRQRVRWVTSIEGAFSRARSSNSPVLMLVGTAWSRTGRSIDKALAVDADATAFLNENFVCLRIDGDVQPEFLNSILPVSRWELRLRPGFQVWFFTPDGVLFESGDMLGAIAAPAIADFQALLSRARNRFDELEQTRKTQTPADPLKQDALALKTAGASIDIDYSQPLEALVQLLDPAAGTIPYSGRYQIMPAGLKFLALIDNQERLKTHADAFFRSPLIDWIEGGFFSGAHEPIGSLIDFDKLAVPNLEMAQSLAIASNRLSEPLYRDLAERAVSWVRNHLTAKQMIGTATVGDEQLFFRSKRVSFAPKDLRELLTTDERSWAQKNMCLEYEKFPIMTVRIPDRSVLDEQKPMFDHVLAKLTKARELEPTACSPGFTDTTGLSTAKFLWLSRLWGDADLQKTGLEFFFALDSARKGSDMPRNVENILPNARKYVGDYLGYCDAALEAFLSTGDTAAFESGLATLIRAKGLFCDGEDGIWNTSERPLNGPGPTVSRGPELFDWYRESTSAQAIRLLSSYARVARDRSVGKQLDQWAREAASRLATFSRFLAVRGMSYFCSAMELDADVTCFVVGPDAVAVSAELFRKDARRLSVPAIGSIRRDLQKRGVGIYLEVRGQLQGALTLDQAREILKSIH